mmetsp:Transcript_14911/g.10814  ORF Transcript_14911/g.10814 Transcript_14911/m.10814 type:complete len:99 (+) Transcript_14911:193-489(+)|eukprot:CAMPEP_0202961640 /NCGR_PEP_ID=MMETSP1396-20130829/5717_1 /ASSEMBLY_ACC=CAM_ASM_000872 /TAXON_ID= /ORGANISM="Pseudokeronopsis sp., Strain Brazil" /LENGTH=98 /DNA_ID=CAMNT_0049681627 /DNA_START=193 /DNA_END=489 /DNA_ORIENTATION=-
MIDCNPCQYLKDPATVQTLNYFEFFCMEPSFDVDFRKLNLQYKEFQKLLHPDKFNLASELMKENSNTLSSYANNAYYTLINDLERSIYILKLNGVQVL